MDPNCQLIIKMRFLPMPMSLGTHCVSPQSTHPLMYYSIFVYVHSFSIYTILFSLGHLRSFSFPESNTVLKSRSSHRFLRTKNTCSSHSVLDWWWWTEFSVADPAMLASMEVCYNSASLWSMVIVHFHLWVWVGSLDFFIFGSVSIWLFLESQVSPELDPSPLI